MTFLNLPDTGTSVLGGDGGVVAYAYQKYPGSTKVIGEEQGLTAFASWAPPLGCQDTPLCPCEISWVADA